MNAMGVRVDLRKERVEGRKDMLETENARVKR